VKGDASVGDTLRPWLSVLVVQMIGAQSNSETLTDSPHVVSTRVPRIL
jgi:hypothetical protein